MARQGLGKMERSTPSRLFVKRQQKDENRNRQDCKRGQAETRKDKSRIIDR